MWEKVASEIKSEMENCIPKVKIKNKKRAQPSWMSKKALRKIKK